MDCITNYEIRNNKVSFQARGKVPKCLGEWSLLDKRMSYQQKIDLISYSYLSQEQGLAKTLIDMSILKIVDTSRSIKKTLSTKISNICKDLIQNVK